MTMSAFYLVVVGITIALIVLLKVLPSREHPFFSIVVAEFCMYCFLAPWYNFFSNDLLGTERGEWYLYLQSICLLLMLPLMVFAYKHQVAPVQFRQSKRIAVPLAHAQTFAGFCVVGSVTYLVLLSQFGLLFRRIGHSELAYQFLNLPAAVFLGIRVFDNLLIPLILVGFLAFRLSEDPKARRLCLVAFLSTLATQLCVSALNSRFQLAIAVAMVWAVSNIGDHRSSRKASGSFLRTIMAVGLTLCGFNFTLNFRDSWSGNIMNSLSLSHLVTPNAGFLRNDGLRECCFRLDGIDLTAQMGPDLRARGLSLGESWRPGITILFGYLWDPDVVREIKANLATTPKYVLMYEYAGIDQPDYPSCIITDAYGNFGAMGIAMAGALVGVVCGIGQRFLTNPSNKGELVLGVIAVQLVSMFEGSLLDLLVAAWIRSIPTMVVLYLLAPIMPIARPKSVADFCSFHGLRYKHARANKRLHSRV